MKSRVTKEHQLAAVAEFCSNLTMHSSKLRKEVNCIKNPNVSLYKMDPDLQYGRKTN